MANAQAAGFSDADVSPVSSNPAAAAATPDSAKTRSKRDKKGNKVREKEAEGTEAADRFEARTVIKSKYSLNGESLEVDPD